jgi:hypothetical protein
MRLIKPHEHDKQLTATKLRSVPLIGRDIDILIVPSENSTCKTAIRTISGGTGMSFDRTRFDHVGIITEEQQSGENFVESTRVWVTNPRNHPANVEYLRYEHDTPVIGPTRDLPHVAYRVDSVDAAIVGHKVLLDPFDVADGFVRVAFVLVEGAVVEFMQYRNPNEAGWF